MPKMIVSDGSEQANSPLRSKLRMLILARITSGLEDFSNATSIVDHCSGNGFAPADPRNSNRLIQLLEID
jgi:hypothetical protein